MVSLDEVLMETREQWRSWLVEHHGSSPGIWLVRWKKNSGRAHLPYDDVVEEALCVGWIDSQPRSMNELQSQLRVTPRRPGSSWSALNKARVAKLITEGRMLPAGLKVIDQAKADGTWTALDDVEQLIEPIDLTAALNEDMEARQHWEAFPRSTKRAILEWLDTARTETTRQARITRIAKDAHQGTRTNQWRQPKRPTS